jgi:hypothetical protein
VHAVLGACRYQGRLRPWIAAAASIALALQLVLASALATFSAAAHAGTPDVFAICHGAGGEQPSGQNDPGKQGDDQSHCVLCTLTCGAHAVLPIAPEAASLDRGVVPAPVGRRHAQVTEYESPTGEYQRGPPLHTLIAG